MVSRRSAWPALPGLRPLREQFSINEFCLPGAAPMGRGHWASLVSTVTSCGCKEAKNTGFLDDLGFNFVFIAPDKIQLPPWFNYVILIK